MQFRLNGMTCLLCTSLPPDSCSGAENHKGSFWISIRHVYTYHRVNYFDYAEDLSVQLEFSNKREILFCNCFWCCSHRPPLAFKFLEEDVEVGIWFLKCEPLPWKGLHDRPLVRALKAPLVRALKAFLRVCGWYGINEVDGYLDDTAHGNSWTIPVCMSTL